jgi:hypothetical protein
LPSVWKPNSTQLSPTYAPETLARPSASRRSLYDNGITIDREVTMKGASKPKKLGKKVAQKSLKEKRQEKRAASKKGFGSS